MYVLSRDWPIPRLRQAQALVPCRAERYKKGGVPDRPRGKLRTDRIVRPTYYGQEQKEFLNDAVLSHALLPRLSSSNLESIIFLI
jgi:hypothetical protein